MDKPDALTTISYLVAAAILLPLGWWLKANYAADVGYFILSLGGLLY
ncbi:hypothetical protein ACLMJV_17140 [Sinorhizobium meliloti]|jgi:hypothetical protein